MHTIKLLRKRLAALLAVATTAVLLIMGLNISSASAAIDPGMQNWRPTVSQPLFNNPQTVFNQVPVVVGRGLGMCTWYGARQDQAVDGNWQPVTSLSGFVKVVGDDGNCNGPVIPMPVSISIQAGMPSPAINEVAWRKCFAAQYGTGEVHAWTWSGNWDCAPTVSYKWGVPWVGPGKYSAVAVIRAGSATFYAPYTEHLVTGVFA